MKALSHYPVKAKLGKQITFAMASHARLMALREKIQTIYDDEKKLVLFEDFQREEYTRRLIVQKENSRPVRRIKQKWELLKCVNSFNPATNKDDSDDEDNLGGPADILKRFKKMR